MSYTRTDQSTNDADITSADKLLEVNVMKAKNPDKKYWDKTYNFVKSTADDLYNGGYVEGTHVRKYDTDAVHDCDNLADDGNTWLNNNKFSEGMYLWVVKCDAAFSSHKGGWTDRKQGFIGTTRYSNVHQTAFSGVHEALHPFIRTHDCTHIQNAYGVSNDHELGKVLKTGSLLNTNQASTMLGHYGSSTAEASDSCDRWKTVERYKNARTNCTKESIELSWKHANGYH